MSLLEVKPKFVPPLDPQFRPIILGNRAYAKWVATSPDKAQLKLGVERNNGLRSVTELTVAATEAASPDTARYVERLVKFLLWQQGGWKILVEGPRWIADHLAKVYSPTGARAFDVQLMERVYEKTFTVEWMPVGKMPPAAEAAVALGGHLDGCRIGFDLGASDYKLAAVKDGEPLFTTEIHWDPRIEADPNFHYQKINDGLKLAASHLPRVDAIGGSSAGIYIDNKVMVASLFRSVPPEAFETQVKPIFLRLQKEWNVPFEVANDGDVTALAGAMSLNANAVLGVAMGSSQAAGYLDQADRITGWLNELAFAPVDYRPDAAADEWSGDIGCGVQYFSQQGVVRLAIAAGIELPAGHPAEQLKHVQELHKQGDPRTLAIYESVGICLGYALAQYSERYELAHVLILGRVTSGSGGDVILAKAREVLAGEFPEIASRLALHVPDEKSKRHGQAVAAASLPKR